jgi:omega-hydroxy-beta-dihydromenaquinone-9 sulfotransferase
MKFSRKITRTTVHQPPVFILGHWRSGTTYLHNLMIQDSQFGYVSLHQVIAPETFLNHSDRTKAYISSLVPKNRPMDNISWSLTAPEEEEHVLGNIYHGSFKGGFYFPSSSLYFPKNMNQDFQQFVLFQGMSSAQRNRWKRAYLHVLKAATLASSGRRLVLKNPANTARIKILLELFPDAKFIHIYRNPYVVYRSTKHMYEKILPLYSLQSISSDMVEDTIFRSYQELMQCFFADRILIPSGNLVEVRYEDLEAEPLRVLESIYDELNLDGFEQAKSNVQLYLESQSNYEKNTHTFNHDEQQKVYDHWKFAIDLLKYNPPQTASQTK